MNDSIIIFLSYASVIIGIILIIAAGIFGLYIFCKIIAKILCFTVGSADDTVGKIYEEVPMENRPSTFDEIAATIDIVEMDRRSLYSEVASLAYSDRPLKKDELNEALMRDACIMSLYDLGHSSPYDDDEEY